MKKLKPKTQKQLMRLCFIIMLPWSIGAQESYQAPQLELQARDQQYIHVHTDQFDQRQHFRVQERPFSERTIASEEEEVKKGDWNSGRDPSSVEGPAQLIERIELDSDVQRWNWQDKI